MPTLAQRRFTSGEIAPAYYPGVDLAKYSAAARTIQNFIVKRTGGLDNRPGTQMIGEIPFSFTKGRLIPFIFNDAQTYQLVFVDKKMYVIKNGAFIAGATATVSAVTKASPGVVTTSAAHSYVAGDLVDFASVGGMNQLNGQRFMVKSPTSTTFQLYHLDGVTAFDTTAFGTFTSGGTITAVLTVVSPYAEADLAMLHFVQSADTVTITNQNYPQTTLTRASDTAWTFTAIQFNIISSPPTSLSIVSQNGSNSPGPFGYAVTTVDATTLEESVAGNPITTVNDVSVSTGRYNQISWPVVANAAYYKVYKTNSTGGPLGFVAFVYGLSWQDVYPGSLPDYTNSPPVSYNPFSKGAAIGGITKANPGVFTTLTNHGFVSGNTVAISIVVGMTQVNGLSGSVVVTSPTTFTLTIGGVPLDTTSFTTYSFGGNATATGLYPATVGYYQERLGFANSVSNPIGANFSRSGAYKNFSTSQPVRDDDGISFNIASREVNEIRHLVDVGTLVILTAGAEHAAQGDISGVLKPSSINRRQRSAIGSSWLQPLMCGDSLILLQKQGSKVYDLGIDVNVGAVEMKPKELSLLATHLTEGFQITDWCYQKTPHSIIWAVRSDGQLLGLTYLKEQEVAAWHKHSIGAAPLVAVENASSTPENNEHAVYLTTKRTIGGVPRRFIERMSSRSTWINRPLSLLGWAQNGCTFLDASLSIDGRNQDSTNPITVTGSAFTSSDTVTLTAGSGIFSSGSVGKYFFMLAPDDTVVRFHITAYTSSTVVSATPNRTVPVALQGGNTWQWAWAITAASGLWHLEGQSVGVTGDGFVMASPNNVQGGYPTITVSGGTITLPNPACVVTVGIPYVATLETLNIDTANGETVVGQQKLIDKVYLWLDKARGVFVGSQLPDDSQGDPTANLFEMAADLGTDDETPPLLISDVREILIQSDWNNNGRTVVRQIDPLPVTLNGIAPDGLIPFGQGN